MVPGASSNDVSDILAQRHLCRAQKDLTSIPGTQVHTRMDLDQQQVQEPGNQHAGTGFSHQGLGQRNEQVGVGFLHREEPRNERIGTGNLHEERRYGNSTHSHISPITTNPPLLGMRRPSLATAFAPSHQGLRRLRENSVTDDIDLVSSREDLDLHPDNADGDLYYDGPLPPFEPPTPPSSSTHRQLEAPAPAPAPALDIIPPEPVGGELNGTSKKPAKKGKSTKKTAGKKK